jgi:hypothetical protein
VRGVWLGRRGELGSVGLWSVQIEACYGRLGELMLGVFGCVR